VGSEGFRQRSAGSSSISSRGSAWALSGSVEVLKGRRPARPPSCHLAWRLATSPRPAPVSQHRLGCLVDADVAVVDRAGRAIAGEVARRLGEADADEIAGTAGRAGVEDVDPQLPLEAAEGACGLRDHEGRLGATGAATFNLHAVDLPVEVPSASVRTGCSLALRDSHVERPASGRAVRRLVDASVESEVRFLRDEGRVDDATEEGGPTAADGVVDVRVAAPEGRRVCWLAQVAVERWIACGVEVDPADGVVECCHRRRIKRQVEVGSVVAGQSHVLRTDIGCADGDPHCECRWDREHEAGEDAAQEALHQTSPFLDLRDFKSHLKRDLRAFGYGMTDLRGGAFASRREHRAHVHGSGSVERLRRDEFVVCAPTSSAHLGSRWKQRLFLSECLHAFADARLRKATWKDRCARRHVLDFAHASGVTATPLRSPFGSPLDNCCLRRIRPQATSRATPSRVL